MFKLKHIQCLLFYFCLLAVKQTSAQQNPSKYLAESITLSALKKHINILASDEMEGRENGKKGQKKECGS